MNPVASVVLAHALGLALLLGYAALVIRRLDRGGRRRR